MRLSRETIERIDGLLAEGWDAFVGQSLTVEMALKRWQPPIAYGVEVDWQCRGEYENSDDYPYAADGWRQCGVILPTGSLGERETTARADNALPSIRLSGLPGSAERIAAYRAHNDRLPGVSAFTITDEEIADNLALLFVPNQRSGPSETILSSPEK